jgi:surface-anchored protein
MHNSITDDPEINKQKPMQKQKKSMKTPILLLAGLLSAGLTAHAGKIVFSDIHADIDLGFENGELALVVHDHTHDIEYDAKDVILQVNGGARTTVPTDPAYRFLGAVGAAIWILPAVQDPNLLFLGLASEEVDAGIFLDDTVRLTLKRVRGPGDFAMYAIDPFGSPVVYFNTRDGVTANDAFDSPAGGHTDFNFAFSKSGQYHITFEATGILLDGTFVASGEVTYTFRVLRANSAEL